jgi:hypothetical protein
MSRGQLKSIRTVTVPSNVISTTLQTMREFGSHGWEALVLWLGHVDGAAASVTTAYIPKQKSIASEDGVGYFVAGDTLFRLNQELSNTGLRLIAQVHSHPREAYHSEADDRYAIVTADGGFSLVVPDFGRAPPSPAAWAVYRLSGTRWCELSRNEVQTCFLIGAEA